MAPMHPHIESIFATESQIRQKVTELGDKISTDYEGLSLLAVGILKGASVFYADLVRAISVPVGFDFMTVSSYNQGDQTSGAVRIIKDLEVDITGVHVLIVEDILDTGLTLFNLKKMLWARKPASLRICTLLDKPERRSPSILIQPDYVGFTVPDQFLVGYGLDYAQQYRSLPYVGILKPEIYTK